ncbi:MAG: ankyrin repeat domain-containing protein [Bryobacteraceae bacterium]
MASEILESLGGETGCGRLARAFYARVARDAALKPLFPGRSMRCAIEEFTSFLVQFLDGGEDEMQHRRWLSLLESHRRFQIGPAERQAWLRHMRTTLEEAAIDDGARAGLRQFFESTSLYITGRPGNSVEHGELGARWREQRALDDLAAAVDAGRDEAAISAAARFETRPSVFVGVLARMVRTGRDELLRFTLEAIRRRPALAGHRYAGSTLLHWASGAGCVAVTAALLELGMDADLAGRGGHTPLYNVANECGAPSGPLVVERLVRAGADVNRRSDATRATPLHAAARRGHVAIARALLDSGADPRARDSKGATPLDRARNCRQKEMVAFLAAR